MGRINLFLSKEEDEKLDRFKKVFNLNSKEDVIKQMIKDFPDYSDELNFPEEELI
jgi:hypothetical protein